MELLTPGTVAIDEIRRFLDSVLLSKFIISATKLYGLECAQSREWNYYETLKK